MICKFLPLAIPMLFTCMMANAQSNKKIVENFPVKGDGKWDYLSVYDNALYVSHGTAVNILDKKNGKPLATIDSLSGVHGIVVDKKNGHGFISNGKMNNVVVFDISSYKVVSKINTGNNPDFIMLEPFSQTVITGNGKSNSLSVIDLKTLSVKTTIEIEGKPEAIVTDNSGKAYVNLEDKNKIAVINTSNFTVEKYIPLEPSGEEPTGLAIDLQNHLLFAGCGNQKLLVIQLSDDKIIAEIPIGEDCDGVVYNQKTKTVYASNADGTVNVIQNTDGKHFQSLPAIKTQHGAKTMCLDEAKNTLYLSVATISDKKDAAGKAIIEPGTFKVIVLK